MSRANVRRVARIINGTKPDVPLRIRVVTVAAVTPGAATDGNAAVTVTYGSDTFPAPYLASYTPTVGDVVLLLLNGPSPLIVGQVIGFPVI